MPDRTVVTAIIFLSFLSLAASCSSTFFLKDDDHLFDNVFNASESDMNDTEILEPLAPKSLVPQTTVSPLRSQSLAAMPSSVLSSKSEQSLKTFHSKTLLKSNFKSNAATPPPNMNSFFTLPPLNLQPLPTMIPPVLPTIPSLSQSLKSLPMFQLPRQNNLFGNLKAQKLMPFGKHSDFTPRLLVNPTWRFHFSPPVSWTYCFVLCGSGDQAIDAENALDNALVDVATALSEATTKMQLSPIPEDKIKLRFVPQNALLEEFGNYFDRQETRYRVVRGAVRYSYTKDAQNDIKENIMEMDVVIHLSVAYTEKIWKSLASEMATYLTNEKYMFIKSPPQLVSYSVYEHSLFFL